MRGADAVSTGERWGCSVGLWGRRAKMRENAEEDEAATVDGGMFPDWAIDAPFASGARLK